MDTIVEQIKRHEGFESKPYIDILVKKDPESVGIPKEEFDIIEKHFDKLKVTFGYGFTYITKAEAETATSIRINQKISEILEKKPIIFRLPLEKQEVIFNMVYQMGVSGVLKFRNMWYALERFDYEEAALQMLDSRWSKQTPKRAEELAKIMGGIKVA